jgi:hypothetical protein
VDRNRFLAFICRFIDSILVDPREKRKLFCRFIKRGEIEFMNKCIDGWDRDRLFIDPEEKERKRKRKSFSMIYSSKKWQIQYNREILCIHDVDSIN